MVVREERKRGVADQSDDRDRDSYSRRRDYRREREPSPKKFRRDRERDRERDERSKIFSRTDLSARDSKHRNSSREAERTRDTKGTEAKRSTDGLKDGSEKQNNGAPDADGLRPDPKEFARSKIYLQHDERGSSGQVVQIHIRHDTDNTRSNLKEHKSGEKKTDFEVKISTKKKDDSECDHDGFSKRDPAPPSEEKRPPELELGSKNPSKEHSSSHSAKGDDKKLDTRDDIFGRKDDRVASRDNISRSRQNDRFGRRDEGFNRGNGTRSGNWQPRSNNRDRIRGRGPPRGQDRFSGSRFRDGNQDRFSGSRFRDGNQLRQATGVQTGVQTDRWKHDKYEEANQSPTNEDDQIAKVEELLAL